MFKVVVLMSTYNGERYIKEQIDSIISQTIKVKLIVRDDGSRDKTQVILEEYRKQGKLDWYQGENIGFVKSFLTLLKNAPKADYYAFADQDDYWEKNKLEVAIEKIKNEQIPCTYCSNLKVVDENLKQVGYYFKKEKMKTNLDNILLDNIAAGCTMVFNYMLANLVNKCNVLKVSYHDWWICILAAAFGKIIYDENSYIKYRQHGTNVVGFKKKNYNFIWLKNKFISIINKEKWSDDVKIYCRELLRGYRKELTNKQIILLEDILFFNNSWSSRFRLIFNKNFSFGTIKGNVYKRVLILFGRD